MTIAIYPGTFDPVTCGHVDIVERAARIFTKVIAVVSDNPSKSGVFSIEERLELVYDSVKHIDNVEVVKHCGLTVDCFDRYDATVIIRGLRAISDFDYEFQMAFTNRELDPRAETIFLMPSAKYTYLSSTLVRQIASLGGDISSLVPSAILPRLMERFAKR